MKRPLIIFSALFVSSVAFGIVFVLQAKDASAAVMGPEYACFGSYYSPSASCMPPSPGLASQCFTLATPPTGVCLPTGPSSSVRWSWCTAPCTYGCGVVFGIAQCLPPPSPTLIFSGSPLVINVALGQTSTLTWSAAPATSCTANGAWIGPRPLSGSEVVSVPGLYELTCFNVSPLSSTTKFVTISAIVPPPPPPPPPSASITGPGAGSWQNADFALTYDALNASSCDLETRSGSSGPWVSRGASCGSGQSQNILVPGWCSVEGANECGVRVKADTAQDTRNFSIDLTLPSVSIASPPAGSLQSADFQVTYSATDATINECRLSTKDGPAPWTDRGSIACGPSQTATININLWCAASGINACGVRILADDNAGNIGQAERFFSINGPPTVDAGPLEMTVDFGFPIELRGSATDDGLPNPPGKLTVSWSHVGGPGSAIFSDPESVNTDVQLTQAGEHILQLKAFDGELTSADNIKIKYGAPPRYGLLPCGVIIDNPATLNWDETDPCEFKHVLLLVQNLLNFALWKLVPLLVVVLVVATGAIFFFQLGGPEVMATVRRIWSALGKGVLILLFSWLFLNFLLGILGFDINLFGRWYEINA